MIITVRFIENLLYVYTVLSTFHTLLKIILKTALWGKAVLSLIYRRRERNLEQFNNVTVLALHSVSLARLNSIFQNFLSNMIPVLGGPKRVERFGGWEESSGHFVADELTHLTGVRRQPGSRCSTFPSSLTPGSGVCVYLPEAGGHLRQGKKQQRSTWISSYSCGFPACSWYIQQVL